MKRIAWKTTFPQCVGTTGVSELCHILLLISLLVIPSLVQAQSLAEFGTKLEDESSEDTRSIDQYLKGRRGFSKAPALPTTVLWLEDWEGNWTNDWHADAGTWEAGIPTSGPNGAYAGENVLATILGGNYSDNITSRMIRHTQFVVPASSENPRLRFWHWYSFSANDAARVQIKVDDGDWETISASYTSTGSNVWTRPSIDLTLYAGSTVQIAFLFQSRTDVFGRARVSTGWYLDDVAVITGPIVLENPEGWEMGLGEWAAERGTWEAGIPISGPNSAHTGVHVAATVLGDNYHENVDSRLKSPAFVVPAARENPRLRFWHWYSFSANDAARVQIKVDDGDSVDPDL